jgi:methionyl aminopeptidase
MVQIWSDEEIEAMKPSAQMARKALDFSLSLVRPGVTGEEIDRQTHNFIVDHGFYPSPVNYMHFPKSICFSPNEVACHGIPDDREIREGDVVSIDISLFDGQFHGDNCGTAIAGQDVHGASKVVEGCEEALLKVIREVKVGDCLSRIGQVIEEEAEAKGLVVIPIFCGHGIGHEIHLPPQIIHVRNNLKFPLHKNMVFTIEPIFCDPATEPSSLRNMFSKSSDIDTLEDQWTAVTKRRGLCAQFEHMVAVREDGLEILTINPDS